MSQETIIIPIGWCNTDADVVMCNACFAKLYKDNEVKFAPIKKGEEGEDNAYVCDECNQAF